jgi:alkaline phosphatase
MKFKILCAFLAVSGAFCDEQRYHPRKTKEEVGEQREGLDPLITLDGFTEVWNKKGQDYLAERLNYNTNNGKAKNVIMFLGDGLSMVTTAATRMYMGGEEVELSYERFPHLGFVKTYCVDRQVADSACTGEGCGEG